MTASHDISSLPLPQQLQHWAKVRPNDTALRQKKFGIWQTVTWSEYDRKSRWFGLGLIKLGLQRGQTVAVLSENCQEWVIAELGIAMINCVTAGVYPTSPAAEVEYLLALSDAPIVVVEDQEQLDKVLAIRERLPHLVAIVVIDPKGLRRYDRNGMWDFEDIVRMGSDFEKEEPAQSEALLKGPQLDDIALMVFTSGSTGKPKAAMMSWRGLGCAAQGLNSMLGCTHQHSLVSYLPLCHVAEQMFSIHIPLYKGAVVNFAESLRTIQEDLRELSPQIFFGVPRIWEKFHSSIQSKIRESGRLQQWLFESAMSSLENIGQKSRSQWSLFESTVWWFWYVLILRSLVNFVGLRRCNVAVSSGAPISPEILSFFRKIGVPIREAYGLTEASGATTMQPSDMSPVGTVGVSYPGVEVKLADDGEILISGNVVFVGYYKNEAATREAIDAEGWLHTGDVAKWEEGPAGRELRIIDRKKDIMITAGGKNITPSEIENSLKFSSFIKEAVIVADRRRFVSALIQIDFESVSKWATDENILFTNFKSLVENPTVFALIQKEVEKSNSHMPQVQQVRKFHLFTKELDHDDGEVTATMKVKRKSIYEKYTVEIETMYA
jgi:long-chain acyl-CoA synthetase